MTKRSTPEAKPPSSPAGVVEDEGGKAEPPYTWGHCLVETDAGTRVRVDTKLFGVPEYDRRQPLYASNEDVYKTLKDYTSVDLGHLYKVSRELLLLRPKLYGAGPSEAPGNLTAEALERLLAGSGGSAESDPATRETPAAATARSVPRSETRSVPTSEPMSEPKGNESAGPDGAASGALGAASQSASSGATPPQSVATPPEGVKSSLPEGAGSAPLGKSDGAPGDLPCGSPGCGPGVTGGVTSASADRADLREEQVTFGCGHHATLPVSTLDPLQLELELEPYRQGPCLACIAENLSLLTHGVMVWRAPDLVVSQPQLAALAERRRYEMVRDFVADLAHLPERVLDAYYALQFEVLSVLGDDDGDTWRVCRHRVQDLLWLMVELSDDQLAMLGAKPRRYNPARAAALATFQDYREYEKWSLLRQWLSRVWQPRRYRGFG